MIAHSNSSTLKIGIYVRQSRDDNEENYETLENQRDLLIDFAKKSNFGDIKAIYVDDNVSGSVFERDGIKRLKDDVVSNNIELLLLKDLSRLGRNNAKTLLFLDYLEEHSIRVITYDGRYDSAKDNDTVGIETWFNERYIRDISQKIRASLRFKIQRGEHIGKAPFGYMKSTETKNTLVINEDSAVTVRHIYKLYNDGYGFNCIANILNLNKTPSPSQYLKHSQNSGWNAVAIQRILKNQVYIGNTVQGVSEKISFKSKKTRKLPKEKWVVTENTHVPIIDREEFEAIQKIITRKSNIKGKEGSHIFKGIMYCGRCGSQMYSRKRTKRQMGYICSNYMKNGKEACSSHYISEIFLKELLSNEITKKIQDKKTRRDIENFIKVNHKNKEMATKISELIKTISSKKRYQEILYCDRLSGNISKDLFNRINSNLELELKILNDRLNECQKKNNEFCNVENGIEAFFQHLQMDNIDNYIVTSFVEKIIICDCFNEFKSLGFDSSAGISEINGIDEGAVVVCYKY